MTNENAEILLKKAKQLKKDINSMILMLEAVAYKSDAENTEARDYDPDSYLGQWFKYPKNKT